MATRRSAFAFMMISFLPAVTFAAGKNEQVQSYIKALEPQHDMIELPGGIVRLNLPDDLGYLTNEGTNVLRQQILGHTLKVETLGSLIPTSVPIGSAASWDATITYKADGHVDDAGASHLDSAALMTQIRKDNTAHNTMLDGMGYRKLETDIVGWASEPRYDAAAHSLSWAVEVKPTSGADEVHYEVRVFGRAGTLQMETSGNFIQLPMLEGSLHKAIAAVEFTPSNRYADYKAGTDKKVSYGIADIITGHLGAAAKTK